MEINFEYNQVEKNSYQRHYNSRIIYINPLSGSQRRKKKQGIPRQQCAVRRKRGRPTAGPPLLSFSCVPLAKPFSKQIKPDYKYAFLLFFYPIFLFLLRFFAGVFFSYEIFLWVRIFHTYWSNCFVKVYTRPSVAKQSVGVIFTGVKIIVS